MIEIGTGIRVLHDIWRWKPTVEPKVRGVSGGTMFIWPWAAGRRAIQRIACLQLHTQLLGDLRRRLYIEGSDDELTEYLQQLVLQARRCVPEQPSDGLVGMVLRGDGSFSRAEVPSNYRAPKIRTEDEAVEEAEKMDEEWGDESAMREKP